MISKTLVLNKQIHYSDIFHKIYSPEKLNIYKVSELHIDDYCISYDLISKENEVSISLLLDGNVGMIPTIKSIVVSIEHGDLNLLNDIKSLWLQ